MCNKSMYCVIVNIHFIVFIFSSPEFSNLPSTSSNMVPSTSFLGNMVPSTSFLGLDSRKCGPLSSSNSSAKLKLENEKLRYEMSEMKKLLSAAGVTYHNTLDSPASNNPSFPTNASRISQSSVDSGKYGEEGNNVMGTPGYQEMSDGDKVKVLEEDLTRTKEILVGKCIPYDENV